MNVFFGAEGNRFIMYSTQHWIALCGLLLGSLTIIIYRRKLRSSPWNERFRYGLAVIMLLLFAALQLWYVRADQWSLSQSLPLHLSTVSLILSAILLLNRNHFLFEFIYFAGVGSALQAMFTPVLDVAFPHFWYFYFFIGHGGIIMTALFFIAVEQYRPTLKSIGRTMLWLNLMLVAIFPINLITGGNYMFIAYKPHTVSILDWLGPWPWYILSLEVVAVAVCFLLYAPFAVRNYVANQ